MQYRLNDVIFTSQLDAARSLVDKVMSCDCKFWFVRDNSATETKPEVDGILVMSGSEKVARVVLSQRCKSFTLAEECDDEEYLRNFMVNYILTMGIESNWDNCTSVFSLNGRDYLMVNDIDIPADWKFQYGVGGYFYTTREGAEEAIFESIEDKLFSNMFVLGVQADGKKYHLAVLSGDRRKWAIAAENIFGRKKTLDKDMNIVTAWGDADTDEGIGKAYKQAYRKNFRRGLFSVGDRLYVLDDVTPAEGWYSY